MALNMVKEGYVAVAVDNAAAGEASDLECYDKDGIMTMMLFPVFCLNWDGVG